MSAPVKVIEKDGYKINIYTDNQPANPRTEWDNLGTMICFHNRYVLGDKTTYKSADFNGWADLKKHIETKLDAAVVLPIYMYDHSGITISTERKGQYADQWDAGQVGFVYISKAKARTEYSVKRISKKLQARLTDYLRGEVETYDNYLTGSVYGYKLENPEGEEIGSCWGFYGDDNEKSGLLDAANSEIPEILTTESLEVSK